MRVNIFLLLSLLATSIKTNDDIRMMMMMMMIHGYCDYFKFRIITLRFREIDTLFNRC